MRIPRLIIAIAMTLALTLGLASGPIVANAQILSTDAVVRTTDQLTPAPYLDVGSSLGTFGLVTGTTDISNDKGGRAMRRLAVSTLTKPTLDGVHRTASLAEVYAITNIDDGRAISGDGDKGGRPLYGSTDKLRAMGVTFDSGTTYYGYSALDWVITTSSWFGTGASTFFAGANTLTT